MAAEKKKWKIKTIILLHFARLFVTLASPKLLSLDRKEKLTFSLYCPRLFVTLHSQKNNIHIWVVFSGQYRSRIA